MQRRARVLVGSTLLLGTVLVEAAGASAPPQTPEFHHLQGGFVTWPWLWKDPNGPDTRVWTSEDGGRIRFRDSSGTWMFQSPVTHKNVYRHIFMLMDGKTGIAVGDHGQWAWTLAGDTPSGAWHGEPPIEFPAIGQFPRFRNVYMSEAGTFWVVGDGGVLASTTSFTGSGLTQNAFTSLDPVANGIDLLGIDFVDGTTIGAATGRAGGGVIYFTTNGTTWTPATITFLNPNTGQSVPPPTDPQGNLLVLDVWGVNFVPGPGGMGQLTGYAVGGIGNGSGYMFRTDDGGQTWTQEFHQCAGFSICPVPETCSFPPQACPPGPAPVWEDVYSAALTLYSVCTFEDGSAIAAGYGGNILRRGPTGGSSRWQEINDLCNFHSGVLWGTSCDGVDTAYVTGMFGTIRRTDDDGQTWVEEGWNEAWRLRELAFVSGGGGPTGSVGWASGQNMRIAKTTDGGVTWTEQRAELSHGAPNFGKNIVGLAFHDDGNASQTDDNGVAVGHVWTNAQPSDTWGIFYTTNGGAGSCGWQTASVNPSVPLTSLADVSFAGVNGSSNREFWAVGGNVVLRSTSNGASWVSAAPPGVTGVTWTGVSFNSIDVGFLVGFSGTAGKAYFVQNASTAPSWSDVTPVAGCHPLTAVKLVGVNGYAVGDQGTVLRYNRIAGKFVAVSGVGISGDLLSVAVIGATSPHQVFVGGVEGVVSHFDGSAWFPRKSHTNGNLSSLSFLSTTLGYGCGSGNETVGGQTTLVKYY